MFTVLNDYEFLFTWESREGKEVSAHFSATGRNEHEARSKIERGLPGMIILSVKKTNETINWI